MEKSYTSPYYPDIAVMLILIPFINAFNYYLTYPNISFNTYLIITFLVDTCQGYAAWWAVRAFIIYLDKTISFESHFLKRLVLQLAITMMLALAIIIITTEIISFMVRGRGAPLSFYTTDIFIISVWFFVINGIYIGLHYYNLWKQSEKLRTEQTRIKSEGLVVKNGKNSVHLQFENITGFYVDGDYAVVCDTQNRKFYMDMSMDKIESRIPSSLFFRLNRQVILHRQSISGFKRSDNGKLIIIASPVYPVSDEIIVSRLKASAFKEWFNPAE